MTIKFQRSANTARRLVLLAIHAAGSGHPGGALSCTDLLIGLFSHMRYDPANPEWPERDRLVLSKGHSAPALYAVAALSGMFAVQQLKGFRKLGHSLQGHPHVGATPWVETSTGSLGQGFSAALGMALGLRHQGNLARVFVLLGDGELQEGELWEAMLCGAHFNLGKLCAILDYNKLQSDDYLAKVLAVEPLADKIRSFGWHLQEIDGHDPSAIQTALETADRCDTPSFIIAHTLKGKGVGFMEGRPEWHGSVKLSDADLSQALTDLGASPSEIDGYLNGHWSN
ncbi:MAG: transketolase [Methylococcaceae bacterium]|nr:transketolase [Methylococcaceae bacterium]